jgi:hypothetical protein
VNNIQKIALMYVVIMLVLTYGYVIGRFQVFPYHALESLAQDFEAFSAGDQLENKTSVFEKLQNDLGFSADRVLYSYPELAVKDSRSIDHVTLAKRKEPPRVFVAPEHQQGYRVVIGAMDLENAFWGGLLLGPTGDILHTWALSMQDLPGERAKGIHTILYGVDVFPDGSVIFNMGKLGGGIVKVDACSNVVWDLPGLFHHTITGDEHGGFWTFIGVDSTFNQDMVKVSVDTGEIVQRIDMEDVRKANPGVSIWDLEGGAFTWLTNKNAKVVGNMTHGNDIDPMPQSLAADFPQFSPGDLAISYRSTNLIFILDPNSLKVKWWRVGVTDTQHDVDWEPGGTLSIFSNNQRTTKTSDVVSIRPSTFERSIAVEGAKLDLFSSIQSSHDRSPHGTRMITSAQQGWIVEVDENQERVFSFINNLDFENRKALHVSDAFYFDEDYFDEKFWEQRCQPN